MRKKPTRVEPGQRYAFGVVTAVFDDFSCGAGHAGKPGPHVHYSGDAWDLLVDVGTGYNRYLGSGTSSPVPAAQECTCNGACGSEAHDCGICGKHCPGKPAAPPPAEPPPANEASELPECKDCRAIGKFFTGTKCSKHREAAEYAYDRRRFAGEMQQNGVAMSALEAIKARKKPERWVESCDPLHWIPDA